jgi:hypothetical protein
MYIVKAGDISVYKEHLAMMEEIMKHKWYESERVGIDIGFHKALIDWVVKHKSKWIRERKNKKYL